MENKLLKFFKKISTFENGNTTLKDWSKGGLEPTLLILLWKPVLHVRGEVRFWRAGTGHVRGGGQYDLMESVSAKGGFEPASELTSKQVRSKIESYGFGLWQHKTCMSSLPFKFMGIFRGYASILSRDVRKMLTNFCGRNSCFFSSSKYWQFLSLGPICKFMEYHNYLFSRSLLPFFIIIPKRM